jgi:antitoxin SocA-like protein
MPLIQNVKPDLRALIAYIVAGARERRVTLNRTRLVKLLYLVDVESVRTRREPVTGVEWVFFDFGPHADELVDLLEDLERRTALYRAVPDDAPDGEDWIAGTRRTVDVVVERFAALPVNALLDHVYFRTGPMAGARRGEHLDVGRARDDAGPRRALPLRAPARADGVEQRLAGWRASTARRLAPLVLDPPAGLLADAGDDFKAGKVRGRVRVPAGSEL